MAKQSSPLPSTGGGGGFALILFIFFSFSLMISHSNILLYFLVNYTENAVSIWFQMHLDVIMMNKAAIHKSRDKDLLTHALATLFDTNMLMFIFLQTRDSCQGEVRIVLRLCHFLPILCLAHIQVTKYS